MSNNDNNQPIEGFVLAGGESRRMGKPKPRLFLDGISLTERAVNTLAPVCERVRVLSGGIDQRPEELQDVFVSSGGKKRAAIIGLHAALVHCNTYFVAALACDLPFVTGELFKRLVEISLENPEYAAVIPVQPDGRLQPLCALYRPDRCRLTIESALECGNWRLHETVAKLQPRFVEYSEFAGLSGSENFFFNLNTPHDYERAMQIAERSGDS